VSAVGRRYYIVVSHRRNPISGVVFVLIALATTAISGQQPNRRPEPYVAPLLPGEQAWLVTLPAPPAAAGAMDAHHVYIPVQDQTTVVEGQPAATPHAASVTALDRETGTIRWINHLATALPPALAGGDLLVASGTDVHALTATTGVRRWKATLDGAVRAPMLVSGNLLLALTSPDQLVALRLDTREIAWRLPVGAGRVLMTADARAAYLTTEDSRIVCVRLADGTIAWERKLAGTLSAPAVGKDRVLVGSTTNWLWALDPERGRDAWRWEGKIFGGDVIGATVDGDVVYAASLDNIVRALSLGSGNQLWQQDIKTRPVHPPRAFFGTVVVVGLSPVLSTFQAKTGTPVGTWAPPPPTDAELQGPPLIDPYLRPFRVAMISILRDGRVVGARPTGMMFAEPAPGRFTVLPGRPVPRERMPGEPEPVAVPAATAPAPPRR
jgi:outer membrane protein assembly factor BamB